MSYQSFSDIEYHSRNFDLTNGPPIDITNFNIIHYNINSILCDGRLEELSDICRTLNIGVLICTESKLDNTIPTNLLTIPGMHEPIRNDRNRHGGGTIMWISQSLVFKRRTELEEGFYEHIWADVKVKNTIFAINAFYRPPSTLAEDETNFLLTSERILTKLSDQPNPVIASDLNFGNCYCKFPILEHKPLDNRAPDLFESYGLHQLIDIPTRTTENTISLIDLFYVKNRDNIVAQGTLPKIADHDGILCSFNIQNTKPQIRTREIFDYKNADLTGLTEYIKHFDFNNTVISYNVFTQTETYTDVLTEAFSKFVPTRTIQVRPVDQSWTNTFTRLLLRRKNRNYQRNPIVNT